MLGEPGRWSRRVPQSRGALLFCTLDKLTRTPANRLARLYSMSAASVDLNADVGESFGKQTVGDDEALMPLITSANIAAGFHGGDPTVLRRTIRLAARHGVAVGAHPSFPDRAGFGRREMHLPDWEV